MGEGSRLADTLRAARNERDEWRVPREEEACE